MATLEEHANSMTLFYSTSTGKIKCYCTGIQSMDYFGEDRDDYNYNYIIIGYDEFVLKNISNFMVVDDELVFVQPTIQYKLK